MTAAVVKKDLKADFSLGSGWLLVVGYAALAIPTLLTLADQTWSHEESAQGPIVLAAGAWLLWRQLPEMRRQAKPGPLWLTLALMLVSMASYVFGRAYDFITLEAAGLYAAGLAILHAIFGVRALARNWFPLFYLAFTVPIPGVLMDAMTAPLKHFVSFVATNGLQAVGMPVSREGVTIFVAQYQLLVEDACSGMNSLIGLTAISLLYIYLTRGSSIVYSLVLMAFVIPVAIIANILRVVTLILLTYFCGDDVGQGFAHQAAGLFLFGTALLLVLAIDKALGSVWTPAKRTA